MSDWPMFYLVLWLISVAAAAAALVAIPFLYIKGRREIEQINWRLDMDEAARESRTNVRTLSRWELARRMERKNR